MVELRGGVLQALVVGFMRRVPAGGTRRFGCVLFVFYFLFVVTYCITENNIKRGVGISVKKKWGGLAGWVGG